MKISCITLASSISNGINNLSIIDKNKKVINIEKLCLLKKKIH